MAQTVGFTHAEATERYRLNPDRNIKKTYTPNLSIENPDELAKEVKMKQEQIRQYFHSTFELFEQVLDCLKSDEAFVFKPIHKLRHPMIFYHGHTSTFYLNKLVLAGLTTRINPKFEEMFATGVDEMSWDDLNEDHYEWPTPQEVWHYRSLVRDRIEELFSKYTLPLPLRQNNSNDDDAHTFFWAIMMGCEHERIHIETASVHIRELPLEHVKQKHPFWRPCEETGKAPENTLVEFGGGKVSEGRPFDSPAYGWDCDYSDGTVIDNVAPFKASKHLVTNEEFLQFVKDGGYHTQKWWDEEGWGWVSWKKPEHPWFWVKGASGDFNSFRLRVQTEEIPLPWDWPCEVNHLEATAFCNYLSEKRGKNLRLPTEGEWLFMRDECVKTDQWQWTETGAPGNINFEPGWASSCPVTKFQQGKLFDAIGNAWVHCSTPTYPYKGYRPHPLYDDFSMPTFDGRHMMQRGGTWIATGNEATRDARYAFRRHFFQMVGIRYIEGCDVEEGKKLGSILGMDAEVDQAAQMSYSKPPEGKPTNGITIAEAGVEAFKKHAQGGLKPNRALEILTNGGRASFELSPHFAEVIGTDFSARMLQPAFSMRERGTASYSVVTDGATGAREAVVAEAKQFPAWGELREKAFFYQSDPANLHAHLKAFDLIVSHDVLHRTYKPNIIPTHLLSRLNAGGILVMFEHDCAKEADQCLGDRPCCAQDIAKLISGEADLVEEKADVEFYRPETATDGVTFKLRQLVFRKK